MCELFSNSYLIKSENLQFSFGEIILCGKLDIFMGQFLDLKNDTRCKLKFSVTINLHQKNYPIKLLVKLLGTFTSGFVPNFLVASEHKSL